MVEACFPPFIANAVRYLLVFTHSDRNHGIRKIENSDVITLVAAGAAGRGLSIVCDPLRSAVYLPVSIVCDSSPSIGSQICDPFPVSEFVIPSQ